MKGAFSYETYFEENYIYYGSRNSGKVKRDTYTYSTNISLFFVQYRYFADNFQ